MKKKNSSLIRWIIVVSSFVLSFAIILGVSVPESYDYRTGDICEADIYAPREIEDSATTNRRREAAAAQVAPQYKIDYDLTGDAEEKIQQLFASVSQVRAMNITLEGKIQFMAGDLKVSLDSDTLSLLLCMEPEELSSFSSTVRAVFAYVMDKGVSDTSAAMEEMSAQLESKGVTGETKTAAEAILNNFVRINQVYDEELTQAEKEKAMSMVEPAVYKKNQIILRRGEVITDDQIALLSDIGLLKGERSISKKYALATFLFLGFIYLIGAYYIRRRKSEMRTGKLLLLLLLPLLMLVILMLSSHVSGIYAYLIPIPVGAVLVATFIDMELSLVTNICICSEAAVMLGWGEEFLIAMMLYSFVGAVIFKKVAGLSGYAKAMLAMVITGAVAAMMAALFAGKSIEEAVRYLLYGAANGLLTSVIIIGTTPVFENIFNIATPFKLNDLGNPEKPLLKRLMFEAPGTYHHSLMVGNLAEAACIRIGADNQLARVGAYYHDIGKLKRPDYFFENQMGVNPHDALMPSESAEVLRGHVYYGLEIAKQYRLPPDIRDIIAQHHGTTLAGIFYNKAKELDPDAKEDDYRYPGPKPESKEAGIVMLADSCEAAVRSLDEKDEASIRAMVTKIVRGKMTDGQLDSCNLSFRELGEIIDAFVTMQESYFHKRIKYDKEPENGADN